MTNAAQLKALEVQHKELLNRLRLPETLLHKEVPPALQKVDLNLARRLVGAQQPWGAEDVFAESARLVTEVFLGSAEGRKLHLAAEIDLLQRVREGGVELLHRGPFDILEYVCPVTVRGYHVHLIRSGKFRETAFRPEDLKDLAFATGIPVRTVEEAARTLPILNGGALEAWTAQQRRQRDTLAAALEAILTVSSSNSPESDRLAALGSMAEGMAHHFSNLLSVILGYTSLVLAKSELDAGSSVSLHKVAEAAQQARRFTEEVLTLAGQQEEADSITPVHERIQRVLGLLQARVGNRVEVVTQFEAARDTVAAPPGLVHQMVLNLLGNAFDNLPQGGRLTIHTSNPADSQQLRIEVIEQTTESPAGDSDAAAQPRPALARLLGQVARMEGEVSRRDAASGNTHVVVTLPIGVVADAQVPAKKFRRRLAPSAIWVVDDDAVVREMCRRVLTADGHTVAESASGVELQKRLSEEAKPDLIIYDFSMPDVDGLEMVRWMRDHAHRTPVILISGFTAEHPSLKKALLLRKTFLLQKPFSFRDMADMVTIAMGETLVEG